MSNYDYRNGLSGVREAKEQEHSLVGDEPYEVRCNVCKGSGLEIIQGQETDCMNCEGYGTVLT